jgi:uncharacterized lipoprotein NlpE involved in copper resistance
MKAYITIFITVLLAPVISLKAQSNRNSYPQNFIVRTVSGHGFIPHTSIEVTDSKGRSISCQARDMAFKNEPRQYCKTDSLIKSLETCAECKIVKTKAQLDALYKAMKMGTLKCASGYGVPVYTMYSKKADGPLELINKVAKGCGINVDDNKLIDELIAEFEKPVNKNGLMEPNETASARESKPVDNSTDKNFVPQTIPDSTDGFGFTALITANGVMRMKCKCSLTSAEVFFYHPDVKTFGMGYKRAPISSRIYQLTKKSGSDLYDIDIKDRRYKYMYKLEIIPITDTGKKPEFTLINRDVWREMEYQGSPIRTPVKN